MKTRLVLLLAAILAVALAGPAQAEPKDIGTAQGKSVSFGAAGVALTVNGARIVKPNVDCTNGMIHVIDAVLLPPR